MLQANMDEVWVPLTAEEYYVTETADGLDTLEFTLRRRDPAAGLMAERMRILDTVSGQTFWISAMDAGQKDVTIYGQKDLSEWERRVLVGYSNGSGDTTVRETVEAVMPEGWSLAFPYGETELGASFSMQGPTPLEVATYALEVYGFGARYDNREKTLFLYDLGRETETEIFFADTANLRERPEYKGKAETLVTRLYAEGAEGVTFGAVNDGKDYVECFDYTDEVIAGYWRDERYTVPEHLLAAAKEKLVQLCQPERCWTLDVCDLYGVDPEKWYGMELNLFQTARLVDQSRGQTMDVRIVELRRCPHYPEKNQVTVASVAGSLGLTRTGIRRRLSGQRLYEGLEISLEGAKSAAGSALKEAISAKETAEIAQDTANEAASSASTAEAAAQEAKVSVKTLEDSIILRVDSGDGEKTAEVSLSVGGKEQSGTVDMTGLVSFSDLKTEGKTSIHGGSIQTGTITAAKIDVDDLFAQNVTASGMLLYQGENSDGSMSYEMGTQETSLVMRVVPSADASGDSGVSVGSGFVSLWGPDILLNGATLSETLVGLGGISYSQNLYTDASDLDSMLVNGFWAYRNTSTPLTDADSNTKYVYGITMAYGSNYVVQMGFCCYTSARIVRHKLDGTWGVWRFENPPMAVGVEYPTTERNRNGAVVWRKRITYTNTEALGTAGTVTNLAIPHEIENFGTMVRCTAKVAGYLMPHLSTAGYMTGVISVGSANVNVRTMSAWIANCTWDFDIAYTKTA